MKKHVPNYTPKINACTLNEFPYVTQTLGNSIGSGVRQRLATRRSLVRICGRKNVHLTTCEGSVSPRRYLNKGIPKLGWCGVETIHRNEFPIRDKIMDTKKYHSIPQIWFTINHLWIPLRFWFRERRIENGSNQHLFPLFPWMFKQESSWQRVRY